MAGSANNVGFGDPEHGYGKDECHGPGVEEAFDDVYRKLRAEGEAGFLGDEIGPDRVGNSADEGDSGKADHLGSEERERRHILVMLEQACPSHRAENKGQIDAKKTDQNVAPVSLGNLLAKDMEIKVELAAAPQEEGDERGENHQTQDQLSFIQAISVGGVGLIVWPRELESSCRSPGCNEIGRALASRGSLSDVRLQNHAGLGLTILLTAPRDYAAIKFVDHAGNIDAGLVVGRDAVVPVHCCGARVVGGERKGHVVVIAAQELVDVG